MTSKTTSFLVGLFVLIGVLLTVVAIVWIGVTGYFQRGQYYVTYLDESVQGLQKDSIVKFRGVEVGRVEQIRIAPDGRLVAVIMKIDLKGDPTKTAVAQLASTGITGIMYMELSYRRPEEPDLSPRLTFPSEYPVIPSKPSEYTRILSGINEILNRLNQVDMEGISRDFKAAARAVSDLLQGPRTQQILARLEKTVGNLEALSAETQRKLKEVNPAGLLKETETTLAAAQNLLQTLAGELRSLKLPETARQGRNLLVETQQVVERLRRAGESLERLAERLEYRPADLLFGQPPTPRWNERPARAREVNR